MTKPITTVFLSLVTSCIVSIAVCFLYFHAIPPSQNIPSLTTAMSTPSIPPKNSHFATYEAQINPFLDLIRKGKLEDAYKQTSPVFQQKTTTENFKSLITGWSKSGSIPTSSCVLTEYSEPFSSTITGLPNAYMITQTKCETVEDKGIKGFDIEFIDDNGTPKISYINAYTGPVIHKNPQVN